MLFRSLIVDMMVEHGVDGMYERISSAARWGGLQAADVMLSRQELEARTELLWERIENGAFASELLARIERKKNGTQEEARI